MTGKGSKQRPTNIKSFNDNFDRIFNNKSELKKEKANEDKEKNSGANTTVSNIDSGAS
jgi:hypothetical protein